MENVKFDITIKEIFDNIEEFPLIKPVNDDKEAA